MERLRGLTAPPLTRSIITRDVAILVASLAVVLTVITLLLTRQILYFDDTLQTLLYILIVVGVFGIGSWVLLEYTKRISTALRVKSRFISRVHIAVTIIQFVLLGIMVSLIFYNSANCYGYFSFCSTHLSTVYLAAISSGSAAFVLGLFSYRFFSWYKSSSKNFILLFYGLATAALCMSIAGDAIAKFVVTEVVIDEKVTSAGTAPDSSFVYNTFSKYEGDVKYRVTNPEGSTLYVAPGKYDELYSWINYLTSYPRYILLWISTCLLLHFYYQRIGQRITKFPIKYWILLFIPLLLYLIGSGLIFSLPDDSESRYYQRIIYRAGTIGSSVLFGAAFYIISRSVPSERVKDYLTIAAIGITMVGIAFSVSAFQQTYGAAAHSLVLISSYLFALGFYASAIFLTQDIELRRSIKKTARRESEVLISTGTPHLEQEIERRVLASAQKEEEFLTERSGITPSLTSNEMKLYLSNVLSQISLLRNYDEIVNKEKEVINSSFELAACFNSSGIHLAYNSNFEEYKKIMLQKYQNGEHQGIRIITKISADSAPIIKKFLDIGIQVKHVDNLPPIDFMVSDKEIVAKVHKVENNLGSMKSIGGQDWDIKNVLVSNEQAYIDYFVYTFSELWSNGSSAKERIYYIDQGLEPGFLEVINDGKKATRTLLDLARSIKEEAQILLPNDRAVVNLEKLGLIDLIEEIGLTRDVKIRLICPITEVNSKTIKEISQKAPKISIQNGTSSTSLMFIVDSSKFLCSEISRPAADEFANSIGFTVYSNSKESVESIKTFFNLLWEQQLRNEELKNADRMQKDFINIAAHELRTPIQPILGLSENLYSRAENPAQKRSLEVIVRNAKRLRKLTETILDVNRIENRKLRLEKESFSLRQLLISLTDEYRKSLQKKNTGNIDVLFSDVLGGDEELTVNADLNRITEVITNLMDNSLKYTKEGVIAVSASKQNNKVVVSIADTGTGIDPTIVPNLFTKFTTRSFDGGTGLGLYISKSIIEAHNGRIWGENNLNGKGATFSFSLPINSN